ncbi:septation protein SepH [Nesterenkonia sp. CF4.4]|uniref:septation protein SepH n=1 Tax=Nesterenkonia sp. CF4.4 TaxID=3373079 RepID=UPI003EE6F597
MQHLRIVGVNDEENVAQLILSDESGREFALPMDEALRHAATRPPVRSSQSSPATTPLTPREIQARLRAGATVDEVVAASGLTAAHVDRYASPVHAERAYIAQRARSTQVAPASSAEAHRAAFGDDPASLDAMVKVQLRAMDVDLTTLAWDSWRREDGLWQITCVFDVDSSSTHGTGIGLRPPAEWTFQPETSHLRAANRWAESLSALTATTPSASHGKGETQSSAAGARRRLSAVDSVFDVETAADRRGGSVPTQASSTPAPGAPSGSAGSRQAEASPRSARTSAPGNASATRSETGPRGEGREHEDLLDVLRARRGQRLGADAEADDRLALMLNRQDPQDRDSSAGAAATPVSPATSGSSAAGDEDEHSTVPLPRLRPVKNRQTAQEEAPADEDGSAASAPDGPADATDSAAGSSADTSESGAEDSPAGAGDGRLDAWGFAYEGESEERTGTTAEAPAAAADEAGPSEPGPGEPGSSEPEAAEKPRKRAPARRASMPKWDDILFGSKND